MPLIASGSYGQNRAESIMFKDVSFQSALEESEATGKPILLYFTAEWCGPCKFMQKYVFTEPSIYSIVNQRFIPVRFDVDSAGVKELDFKVQFAA